MPAVPMTAAGPVLGDPRPPALCQLPACEPLHVRDGLGDLGVVPAQGPSRGPVGVWAGNTSGVRRRALWLLGWPMSDPQENRAAMSLIGIITSLHQETVRSVSGSQSAG